MDDAARLRTNALERGLEVRHCKVQMVWIWERIPLVAVRPRVEARENRAATPKVVAAWRNPTTRIAEDVTIESGGGLNVGNRNDHSKQSWAWHSHL